MPRRSPPRIRPGELSRADADAINDALEELYRLLGGFSASAPLTIAEDVGGVNLRLDSNSLADILTTTPGLLYDPGVPYLTVTNVCPVFTDDGQPDLSAVPANRLIGNPTGSAAVATTIPLGSGLSFVGGALTASGGGGGSGTVTSVSAGNLSPLFTSSVATPTTTPALSFTPTTQSANVVFAGPSSGAAAAPTFRALVTADLPATAVTPATYGDSTHVAQVTVDATGRITAASNVAISGGGGTTIPAGVMTMYAGSSAPSGWLLCDGSAVSRTTYSALFTAIGTTFGAGDGSTTFNVPNMASRVPMGVGTGSGLSARTLGQTSGAEAVVLSSGQLPAHTHTVQGTGSPGGFPGVLALGSPGGSSTVTSSSVGSGTPVPTVPPFLGLNFLIKT